MLDHSVAIVKHQADGGTGGLPRGWLPSAFGSEGGPVGGALSIMQVKQSTGLMYPDESRMRDICINIENVEIIFPHEFFTVLTPKHPCHLR